MADLGYPALLLALVASVYAATAFIVGQRKRLPILVQSARYGAVAVFCLISSSVIILLHALLTHNFQIEYVASYTSSDLSLPYLISALWAGNAGSLLLWAWLLSLCTTVVVFQKQKDSNQLVPLTGATLMIIEVFFLILLVFTSNPFTRLAVTPSEGTGLNPLLQNPAMIIHPPLLLAGYAGFAVPFAFAISALLNNRLGAEWIIAARRWGLAAWLFLGIGNIIGAWWAYIQPGWGGYWAWDPVENAGLMPWLVATAFLHSSMMQRRRGMLKIWNMLLIISVFLLTIFGTFLTRSGIVYSIHSFTDLSQGVFLLVFMLITLSGSLALLYYRRQELKSEAKIASVFSRESLSLLTSVLLFLATYAIFLGTIFPVISQLIQGVRMNLEAAFFNQVNGPIFLIIILLMGICVFFGWQKVVGKSLIIKLIVPLIAALSIVIGLFFGGTKNGFALLGFALCGFAISAIAYNWLREASTHHFKALGRLFWSNRRYYGSHLVHIAILLIGIGIIGSTFYQVEKRVTLMPGEAFSIENYTITYEGTNLTTTPSKKTLTAILSVHNDGNLDKQLTPKIYSHRSFTQNFAEVAIHTTPAEDLYLILTRYTEDGKASFLASLKGLVVWLWVGGAVLLAGGCLCLSANNHPGDAPT